MKKKRCTEEQIIRVLREAESGKGIALAGLTYTSREERFANIIVRAI
jgi:hypothetical protein